MNITDLINTGFEAFKAEDLAYCETLCQQAMAQFPDNADALHLLGLVRHTQGQGAHAATLIRKAIEQEPDKLQFITNLAVVLNENGLLEDALVQCRRAIQLHPGSAAAFNNLGVTLKDFGQMEQAEQAFRKALALAPGNIDALGNLGLCLQLQGRLREAAGYMQASVSGASTSIGQHNYGLLMMNLDRCEEAKAAQLKALQINPAFAPAWLYLVRLNQYDSSGHPDLVAIRQLLQKPDLAEESREQLHFALGKGLDDCGDYDAAFSHFQAGNRIMQRRRPYDRDHVERQVTNTITRFTAEFIRSCQLDPVTQPVPVFIIGLPRSGKTRLERLLCTHADIHRGGELFALPAQSIRLLAKHWGDYPPAPECVIGREELLQAARRYRDFINKLAAGSRYITDTLPANAYHLGVIASLFPNARIISCTRDPQDTLISIYCKHFSKTNRYACRLDDIRWYMRRHERLMQHWHTALPNPILEVCYEDLVTDTAATLQRVADYCELPVSGSLLKHWNDNRLQPRFIGHARHYSQYLDGLAEF